MSESDLPPPRINDPQGCWFAHCPACEQSFDIREAGHYRSHAVSYGLRRGMRCPLCGERHMMRVEHVDREGIPDQPLGFVLKRVLLIQVIVWASLLVLTGLVWWVVTWMR